MRRTWKPQAMMSCTDTDRVESRWTHNKGEPCGVSIEKGEPCGCCVSRLACPGGGRCPCVAPAGMQHASMCRAGPCPPWRFPGPAAATPQPTARCGQGGHSVHIRGQAGSQDRDEVDSRSGGTTPHTGCMVLAHPAATDREHPHRQGSCTSKDPTAVAHAHRHRNCSPPASWRRFYTVQHRQQKHVSPGVALN